MIQNRKVQNCLYYLNKIEELMKRGELVPVQIVLELITEAMIAHLDKSEGFLIDGYPRNVNQVRYSGLYYKIDLVQHHYFFISYFRP